MRRRFLMAALGIILCQAGTSGAQRIARIAVLRSSNAESTANIWIQAFRAALADLGWAEGKSIEILWHVRPKPEEVPALLDRAIALPVDVIVVATTAMALEAMKKTQRIPIVVANSFYPIESGLATSLARPGRNVTGRANNAEGIEINGKQLALLKELAPQVTRVAYLTTPLTDNEDRFVRGGLDKDGTPNVTIDAARTAGITLIRVEVVSQRPVEQAISQALQKGANGLIVDIGWDLRSIAQLAARHKLPSTYTYATGPELGGLMYYGPTLGEAAQQIASFVNRILRGANPAELPFEAPLRTELVINRGAAKAIGLDIPRHLLMQANRVIE